MPIIKSMPNPVGPGSCPDAWHGGVTVHIDTDSKRITVGVASYADRATAYDPSKGRLAGREVSIEPEARGGIPSYDEFVAANLMLFGAIVQAEDAVLLAHPDYAGGVQVPPGPPPEES